MILDKQKQTAEVNHDKRRALKGFGAIAASGLVTAPIVTAPITVFADTASCIEVDDSPTVAPDLEIMMVSKVDVPGESILLSNLTDRDITVTQFQSSRLIFDGEIVDCNDACRNSPITVPAHQQRLVQFRADNKVRHALPARFSTEQPGQPRADYINVHSTIRRLPQGTRVLKLSAHMHGSTAVLSDDAEPVSTQRVYYGGIAG